MYLAFSDGKKLFTPNGQPWLWVVNLSADEVSAYRGRVLGFAEWRPNGIREIRQSAPHWKSHYCPDIHRLESLFDSLMPTIATTGQKIASVMFENCGGYVHLKTHRGIPCTHIINPNGLDVPTLASLLRVHVSQAIDAALKGEI